MGKQPRAPQTPTRRRRAPLTPPQMRCPRTPPPLAPPPQAVAPVPKMQPPPNVPPEAWAGAWAPGGWTWSQELAPRPAPAQDGAWSLGPRPQPPPRVVPPRPRAPQAPQPLRPPGLQPQAPPQALLRARPKTPTAPTATAWKSLPEGPPPPKMRPMQPTLDPPPHLLVPKFASLPHGKVEALAAVRWAKAKLRRDKKQQAGNNTYGTAISSSEAQADDNTYGSAISSSDAPGGGAASSGEEDARDERAFKCIERLLSERMDEGEIKDSKTIDEIKMEIKAEGEDSEIVEWSMQQLAGLQFARAQLIGSGKYGSYERMVEVDEAIQELEDFISCSRM